MDLNVLAQPRPRRLLMTCDTVGGVWTYALELARALGSLGMETALATMGAPLSRAQSQEAAAVRRLELFESRFKLEWMPEPWRDVVAAGEWLLDLEVRLAPDLVHLNGFAHGALPWRAPAVVVGHSCVLSWWRAVHGEPAPAAWDRYRVAVTAGLAGAQLVIAPSAAMLAALTEHYGPFKAARVIPNGRQRGRFNPVPKEPFVLSAGRLWDSAKNVGLLAAIAPALPWPLCVAGEETSPSGDGAAAWGGCVRRLGQLSGPEMAEWLGRASIYALPARYEPFGLSILEAALAGCALVLGDIPSQREIWGDAALLVSPDRPEEVSQALRSLMTEPALLARQAAKARQVAASYTPERMAAGYLEAYAEVLRQGRDKQRTRPAPGAWGSAPRSSSARWEGAAA